MGYRCGAADGHCDDRGGGVGLRKTEVQPDFGILASNKILAAQERCNETPDQTVPR